MPTFKKSKRKKGLFTEAQLQLALKSTLEDKASIRAAAIKFSHRIRPKNISMPYNWRENEAAGEDWLRGFRKRSGNLSRRNPESTSLARSIGFNRPAVNAFFCNLKDVLIRDGTISPQNI